MSCEIPIGNGNFQVAFDRNYALRELSYPHNTLKENPMGDVPFRFGLWVDGLFSWLSQDWKVELDYIGDSLITNVRLEPPSGEIRILANDLVDIQENIYLKKMTIENLSKKDREIRVFHCHDFQSPGRKIEETAVFRPGVNGLLHFMGDRYFLVNVFVNKRVGVDHYTTGNKKEGEGAWLDAEDGILAKNPVAQGAVDSVIGVNLKLKAQGQEILYYWICAGKDWNEVSDLNQILVTKTPEVILKRNQEYWKRWVEKEPVNFLQLSSRIIKLYKRSLLIIKNQFNRGMLITRNDSEFSPKIKKMNSQMGLKDSAFAVYAMDLAGYPEIAKPFFDFCSEMSTQEGSLSSPWGVVESPNNSKESTVDENENPCSIQEDDTALVLWVLWQHYKIYKDFDFIRSYYPMIKKTANFMLHNMDPVTELPHPSYDLWGVNYGVFTYTASVVYGGLMAAANFAAVFSETELAMEYREGALSLRSAMDKYLYLEKENRFARMVSFDQEGNIRIDSSLDASLCGIFLFGAYSPEEVKVRNTMLQVEEKLGCADLGGGIARYEGDSRSGIQRKENPWFVTTLWITQYYISVAQTKNDLEIANEILEWVCLHSLRSGVLPKQVNIEANESESTSPFKWSHATLIAAVQEYLNKSLEIEKCSSFGMPRLIKYLTRPV